MQWIKSFPNTYATQSLDSVHGDDLQDWEGSNHRTLYRFITLSNTVPAHGICMIDSESTFHAENDAVDDFFFNEDLILSNEWL